MEKSGYQLHFRANSLTLEERTNLKKLPDKNREKEMIP